MGRKFTAITCLILIGTNVLLVKSSPPSKGGDDNDSFEDSGEIVVQQPLARPKRGGYIEKPVGYGAAAGGMRFRGPAAVYSGGKNLAGYGGSVGMSTYSTGSGGSFGGGSFSGGSAGGSVGGSLPGPMSLYSYAPRRANAAVYGGIWGPQTNEEALKFDSHMTRSMIAEALASSGRRLYAGHGGLIPAAIQSRRNIQFYDVPSNFEAAEPITVEVGQSPAAQLNIRFKSSSSPLAVEQDHSPAPGSMRETSSEDEPHVLRHTVSRPIFQEVHEVIKPFRRVTQEIQPVQENVETVVARGDEIQGGTGIVAGQVLTADSGEVTGVQQTSNIIATGHGGSVGQGYVQGISTKPAIYGSGSYGMMNAGGQHAAVYSSKPKSYAAVQGQTGGYRQTGYGHGMAAGTGYQKQQITGGGGPEMAQVQIPFARRAAAAASAARGARRARRA